MPRKPDSPEEIERKLLDSVIPNTLADELAKSGKSWAFEGVIDPGEVLQFGKGHLVNRWATSRPVAGPAKSVLTALATRASRCGVMWPTREELSCEGGFRDRATRNAVNRLETMGYVLSVRVDRKKCYMLACAVPEAIAERVAEALRAKSKAKHPIGVPKSLSNGDRVPTRVARGATCPAPPEEASWHEVPTRVARGANESGTRCHFSGEIPQVRQPNGPPLPSILPIELPRVPSELVATASPSLVEASQGEGNSEGRETSEEPLATPSSGALFGILSESEPKPTKRPATRSKPEEWHALKATVAVLAGHASVETLTKAEHGKISRWTDTVWEAGIREPAELKRRWDLDRSGNDKRTFAAFVNGRLTLKEYLPGAAPARRDRSGLIPPSPDDKHAAMAALERVGINLNYEWTRFVHRHFSETERWWADLDGVLALWCQDTGFVPKAPLGGQDRLVAV